MMRFSLFKTTQVKGFDFKPRYYNPEKEEFDTRVAALKAKYAKEATNSEKVDHTALRGKMRSEWNAVSQRKSSNFSSNIRILLIAGVLSILFYILVFTDFELVF